MSTWISPQSSAGISARRRSISASPVETIWMTAAWPSPRSRSIERISEGVFMLVRRCPKKRCLALSNAERAAAFACAFSVPVSLVMFAACMAASRLLNDRERAGIGIIDADLLGREPVLDELIFDALVGERACRIKSERLEVARQHLHCRNPAVLDRLHKLGAGGEWEILAAPQAEALGVS